MDFRYSADTSGFFVARRIDCFFTRSMAVFREAGIVSAGNCLIFCYGLVLSREFNYARFGASLGCCETGAIIFPLVALGFYIASRWFLEIACFFISRELVRFEDARISFWATWRFRASAKSRERILFGSWKPTRCSLLPFVFRNVVLTVAPFSMLN